MKLIALTGALIFFFLQSGAQIICIHCYSQNNRISTGVNNLVLNGGFENHTCLPNSSASVYCPNSNYYSCDITDWICSGGGSYTYTYIMDGNKSLIPEGAYAAYFGNNFASACSPILGDLSCASDSFCAVTGFPTGYPQSDITLFGGSLGVSLSQTVDSLIPGNVYVLEFWAGGEGGDTLVAFINNGIFAVDIGFGNTFFRNLPTLPSFGVGTRFIIEFMATSTTHTIKFTNWGHICIDCTELVIDDVRLYTLAELASFVPSCFPPDAGFSADTALCPGTCTAFLNLSLNATSYLWNFFGGNPGSSTVANPANICYNNPGTYDVQLIATNQAGSDTLTLDDYITVYPHPPAQSITQIGDTLFAIAGAFSYQWYYSGTPVSGATDFYHVASLNGDYNVVATDSNGCETEAVIFNVITFLPSTVDCGLLTIYPNPVSAELKIKNEELIINTIAVISVYNLLGERILAVQPQTSNLKPEILLDIGMLNPGCYFIEIMANEKKYRSKILKQ